MNILFDINDSMLALLGGAFIGVSSILLMLFNGRIAGISGILNGVFFNSNGDRIWRAIFVIGLVVGGFVSTFFIDAPFSSSYSFSNIQIIIAGLLVGLGTKIGNGCTSGHGVCGISRFSVRSIFATLVFIGSGVATVFLMRRLLDVL